MDWSFNVSQVQKVYREKTMPIINVTEFRQHLPAYLKRVQQGEALEITQHGKVIARLLLPEDSAEAARQRLFDLRGKGCIGDVVSPYLTLSGQGVTLNCTPYAQSVLLWKNTSTGETLYQVRLRPTVTAQQILKKRPILSDRYAPDNAILANLLSSLVYYDESVVRSQLQDAGFGYVSPRFTGVVAIFDVSRDFYIAEREGIIGNCADQASLKIPPFEKGGLGGICSVDGDHEPPEIPPGPPFSKGGETPLRSREKGSHVALSAQSSIPMSWRGEPENRSTGLPTLSR
jgi:prevent-host-death family protein